MVGTKSGPRAAYASGSLVFLPHNVYRVSITEQATAKCYIFVLYNYIANKKVKNFLPIFVTEMASAVRLFSSTVDHGSRPMKS